MRTRQSPTEAAIRPCAAVQRPPENSVAALRAAVLRLCAAEIGHVTIASWLGVRPAVARAWLEGMGLGPRVGSAELLAALPAAAEQ